MIPRMTRAARSSSRVWPCSWRRTCYLQRFGRVSEGPAPRGGGGPGGGGGAPLFPRGVGGGAGGAPRGGGAGGGGAGSRLSATWGGTSKPSRGEACGGSSLSGAASSCRRRGERGHGVGSFFGR